MPRLLSSLPLWEELYQGLMDGFLDVSKALWKGFYSRRDCIRQHINFPAMLRAWLKTKDVRFTLWPDEAFRRLEKVFTVDLLFSRFLQRTYGQPISQISVVFVYVLNFCMARQEVKPTLKFVFQVYRQFVCEEGFQDFCVRPILMANYSLISPQFNK